MSECDHEVSTARRPWPTGDCCAIKEMCRCDKALICNTLEEMNNVPLFVVIGHYVIHMFDFALLN